MSPPVINPPLSQAQAILTIDLDALCANWRLLRDLSAPAECAAVIKADGYGLGAARVALALVDQGCSTFFVAQISEGVNVRTALAENPQQARARIFCLNGLLPGQDSVLDMVRHRLQPVIGSFAELENWATYAGEQARALPMALQFSTGMNRLGFAPQDAPAVAQWLAAHPHCPAAFVMSHFISSEEQDNPLNAAQIAAFEAVRANLPALPVSLANSSGIFLPQRPLHDLVRPGYALYGGNPRPGAENPMRRVVSLHVRIIQIRTVQAGETIGYNATWRAPRTARIAIAGIGYADGLLRSAVGTNIGAVEKPGAYFALGGVLCPIVGRVSMDLTAIDVTGAPEELAQPGGALEVLGGQISVDDLAARAGTIGYEILTSLGPRYHRIYRGGRSGEKE